MGTQFPPGRPLQILSFLFRLSHVVAPTTAPPTSCGRTKTFAASLSCFSSDDCIPPPPPSHLHLNLQSMSHYGQQLSQLCALVL
eukprot:jgi/Botrbrau1/19626/Bobra.0828s0003.1